MAFGLITRAFEHGGPIPSKFTCDGADVSPHLKWIDAPKNAKGFAVLCEDPDAPSGTFTHWLVYGLAPDAFELREGYPHSRQGKNDFGRIGYNGPRPPRGSMHHYYFKIFALDAALPLASGATRKELEQAIRGHILAQAEVMGTYQRR